MAILNYQEWEAKVDNFITTNGQKLITGAQLNDILQDVPDSTRQYVAALTGGADTLPVTTTPQKAATFASIAGTTSDVLEPDLGNNRVLIKEPAGYILTLELSGEWANNQDVFIQGYHKGAPVPLFGPIWDSGEGTGNPVSIAWNALLQDTDATPGAPNPVEFYIGGSGSFNVTQLAIVLMVRYFPWSIRNPS